MKTKDKRGERDARRRQRIWSMRKAVMAMGADLAEAMLSRYRDIRTVEVVTRNRRGVVVHGFKVKLFDP